MNITHPTKVADTSGKLKKPWLFRDQNVLDSSILVEKHFVFVNYTTIPTCLTSLLELHWSNERCNGERTSE